MKKMLIFHPQALFDANDLDNHLYDSTATRDDWLDMTPLATLSGVLSETKYHYSEWDLALKEGDEYHYWYLCWCDEENKFPFDNPYLLHLSTFEKTFRGTRARCISVVHKSKVTYAIYKMESEISDRISLHLANLLGTVDSHLYTAELAESLGLTVEYLKHVRPVEQEALSGGRTHNGKAADPGCVSE